VQTSALYVCTGVHIKFYFHAFNLHTRTCTTSGVHLQVLCSHTYLTCTNLKLCTWSREVVRVHIKFYNHTFNLRTCICTTSGVHVQVLCSHTFNLYVRTSNLYGVHVKSYVVPAVGLHKNSICTLFRMSIFMKLVTADFTRNNPLHTFHRNINITHSVYNKQNVILLWQLINYKTSARDCVTLNKNLAFANRSRVSCAHITSRASIGLITHGLEI